MTTIDHDELRFSAEAHLRYGGGGDDLANGVLALLDSLTRAEAQSEARRINTEYWKECAEGFHATIIKLQDAEEILRARAARAEMLEARVQAVRDVYDDAVGRDVEYVHTRDIRDALNGDA